MVVASCQTKKTSVKKETALYENSCPIMCSSGEPRTVSGKKGYPTYYTIDVGTGKIVTEINDAKLIARLRKIAKGLSKK